MVTLIKLGDIINTVKGCAFKSSWFTSHGVPIVKVKDFTEDSISAEELTYIPESISSQFSKYSLQADDIIIQTVGSWEHNPNSVVGKVVRTPNNLSGSLLNQNAVRLDCNKNVDKRFLYYRLKDSSFKNYIIKTAQGAANQASITLDSIRAFQFLLPPFLVQLRIGEILSSYDALIKNNQRRINLLEEAARYQYRLLKENFSTENFVQLADKYETSSGGTPSRTREDYYSGNILWFKTKELNDSILLESEEKITEKGLASSSAKLFKQGTVLLAMYGATIGKVGILSKPAATNQACCAFITKNNIYSNYFIYLFLLENRDYVLSFRMGAAQENISQAIIRDFRIPKVEDDLLQLFNQQVSPLFSLIEKLSRQNVLLREARDILLPKLMSGEIDVFSISIPEKAEAKQLEAV